jgi:hypothetical protein
MLQWCQSGVCYSGCKVVYQLAVVEDADVGHAGDGGDGVHSHPGMAGKVVASLLRPFQKGDLECKSIVFECYSHSVKTVLLE